MDLQFETVYSAFRSSHQQEILLPKTVKIKSEGSSLKFYLPHHYLILHYLHLVRTAKSYCD